MTAAIAAAAACMDPYSCSHIFDQLGQNIDFIIYAVLSKMEDKPLGPKDFLYDFVHLAYTIYEHTHYVAFPISSFSELCSSIRYPILEQIPAEFLGRVEYLRLLEIPQLLLAYRRRQRVNLL
jgi:hypothetical protein